VIMSMSMSMMMMMMMIMVATIMHDDNDGDHVCNGDNYVYDDDGV